MKDTVHQAFAVYVAGHEILQMLKPTGSLNLWMMSWLLAVKWLRMAMGDW